MAGKESPPSTREHLERLVQQRTAKLQAANAELQRANDQLREELSRRKQAEASFTETLGDSLRRDAENSALARAARTVFDCRKFEDAARVLFDCAKELTGATSGYVALLSKDGTQNEVLFLDAGRRPCTVDPDLPMPVRGLRAEAYCTGKAVYENDFAGSRWVELMPAGHVRLDNVLFAPLVIEGKAVGIFGLANKPGDFTDDDARIATAFGELAAVALRNRRAVGTLKASEARYRRLVETVPHGIEELDAAGIITFANRAYHEMHGYAPGELVGTPVWECLGHDADKRELEEYFKQLVSQQPPPTTWRGVNRAKDGRLLDVQVDWDYKRDEQDNVIGFVAVVTDVTARKRAEEALRESEEHFRLVFENSHDLVGMVTADAQRVWVNPAWQEVFGREQQNRKNPLQMIHPDDLPGMQEAWRGLVSNGQEVKDLEFRYQSVVGTCRTFEASAFPVDHSEEKLFCVIAHEVTDRKRTEEALCRSAQELHIRNRIAEVFLTTSDDAIYAEVLEVVLEVLRSEYGVFGYIDEQGALVAPSMNRSVWDQCRVPNKDYVFPRETWGGIWGRALRENRTLYSNEPFDVPEGHIPMRRVLCVPIAYRDQPIGTLEVANKADDYDEEDVRLLETIAQKIAPILNARLQRDRQEEERRRAEEALRDSEERFRAVFEQAASSVVLIDLEDGAIVEFNEQTCQTLGYTREEFETLKISDFEVDESAEQVRAHLKRVLAEGGDSFESKHRTKNGDVRNVVVQTRPIMIRGKHFVMSIWHDITDLKQAEQREANLRADLAHMGRLVTMGEMASGLAHELNQPLTAIATLAHVAAQTLRSGKELDQAQLAAMCNDIGAQALRAGQLIQRMRSFVKKIVPRRTTLDLPEVLDEILSLMKNDVRHAGIAIRLDLDESLPTTFADKIQVEQVLLNLMRNALESMEHGDGDEHLLTIAADACDGHLRISVRDTGVGISPNGTDELFGTFFTTKPEGMGMGLAICRSIVEAHGGRIWGTPNDDRGATFTFTLPILDREDKEGTDER